MISIEVGECTGTNSKGYTAQNYDDAPALLEQILSRLTTAQSIYLHQLKAYLVPSARMERKRKSKKNLYVPGSEEEGNDDPRIQSFVRSLNSIISYSLPDPAWGGLVYSVFLELCGVAVGLPIEREKEGEDDSIAAVDDDDPTIQKEEDVSYQGASQQSFATVTDVDGDIIVDDDRNHLENVPDTNNFEEYKEVGEEEAQRRKVKLKEEKPREDARKKVLEIWSSMEKLGVGGGGRRGERVFAEVSHITKIGKEGH